MTLDSGGAAPNTNPRVAISMAELRSEGLSERLRYDPLRHMRALETACNNIAKADRPGFDKEGRFIHACIHVHLHVVMASKLTCFL